MKDSIGFQRINPFAAAVVFQGGRHGLPLLFQAGGRLGDDDPRVVPRDQPQTAGGAGGHTPEEHHAQGTLRNVNISLS